MPFLNSEVKLKQGQPVQVVQKPPREVDVFRAFNKHARECNRCNKPAEVVRRGEQLCDVGHRYAIDICDALYQIAGNKYEQYLNTTGWIGILYDFTEVNGPAVELVKVIEKALRDRKPATTQVPVYSSSSSSSARKPVSRHSQQHHHHHHDHHHSSSSGYRHATSAPHVHHHHHHHHTEPEHSPRASGNLRLYVPNNEAPEIDYHREPAHYEEVYHPNGGRVTTKYYHSAAPKLIRANTIEPAKPSRKSTVRFDSEVKYYT